jgi:hypothetical protein
MQKGELCVLGELLEFVVCAVCIFIVLSKLLTVLDNQETKN